VSGLRHGEQVEDVYTKKYFFCEFLGMPLLGIQFTVACQLCAVVDLVLENPKNYQGFIRQEKFKLSEIHENRFGKHLK